MLYLIVLLLSFTLGTAGPRIVVEDPWVRDVPPVAKTTAAFMKIKNTGNEEDTLIGVVSDVAEMAEIHETVTDDGIVRMRKIGSLSVPPGSTVILKPMGKHIMLMGLKESLKKVGKVRIVLIFRKSGRIVVEAPVRRLE